MPRDIRSYFTTISKKTTTGAKDPTKEKLSNNDFIPGTPPDTTKTHKKAKENIRTKRKRIVNVSSDSEPESEIKLKKTTKTSKKEPINTTLNSEREASSSKRIVKKVISPIEAFGNEPVKQDKVETKKQHELNIHDDDDFDKTLLELDEEELLKTVDSTSTATANKSSNSTEIINNKNQKSFHKEPKEKESNKTRSKVLSRKRTCSSEINDESSDPDQVRYEKKRYSAMLYQKYLHRNGPPRLGAKWIPKGKPDCLKNLSFIITGVLNSLEREQAETLIKEHGGRCTHSVSGKINYMVLGEDAGPAKVEKAGKLGIKIISEDDLIDLICVKSGIINQNLKPDSKSDKLDFCDSIKSNNKSFDKQNTTKLTNPNNDTILSNTTNKTENKKTEQKENSDEQTITSVIESEERKNVTISKERKEKSIDERKSKKEKNANVCDENLAWVDKYKPIDVNQIIGQQGERSNVKKLMKWLCDWHKNRVRESTCGKGISRPSPWARDDDGAYFRAALLSGPPGVGKTTSSLLVCKQLGFDTVEFNASDTRNKRMVHNEVSQIIKSTSLAGYFQDGSAPSSKHVLLMDEVDGMSGNEDRGGIQELITIIKTSNVPIICMCNDRQHPKIRTLANYCFDLRYSKPRLEQIRGAMMSICFKEGIKIKPDALTHIIQGTGQDIRQTLNQLSLWSAGAYDDTETVARQAKSAQKDVKLGPWEVIRKVFSAEEHKGMNLADKSKLFFHDYSIGPLFVQENYLKMIPHCPKNEQLQRFANAADAISMGDVVDARIRSTQNWGLLELQAMFASVLPGHFLEGHFGGQIDFPGWLGKNSKANKFQRMLSEINAHTRMSISGDRTAIGLDYIRSLRDAIVSPLLQHGPEGIQESIAIMRAYNLLREDLTNLIELNHWPKSKDPFDSVESKVKAAFTRNYNKIAPALPYAAPGTGAVKSKRATATSGTDVNDAYSEYDGDDAPGDESNDDDDIKNDAMIKAKKPTNKTSSSSSKASSSGKGKALAKPRGGGGIKRGSKK